MKFLTVLILGAIVLVGCRTVAKRFELIDNKMVLVERMELRGVGKNKADFDAKKIENDSGFKVPFGNTELSDLPRPNVN